MSRTHDKWSRIYIGGYDMSGYAHSYDEYGFSLATQPMAALSDGSKNVVVGQATVEAGNVNAFLAPADSGASEVGFHELLKSGTGTFIYTIAFGVQAEPVAGDILFSYPFELSAYKSKAGEGFNTVSITWAGATSTNSLVSAGFAMPFGRILNPKSAKTAVNSSTGIDDFGASTALGGVFVYHLFSSNGTVTLKAQHAATNLDGSFADITGATSGSINGSTTPASGMVATSTSLTINRYLRWQLVFGTATTATFFCGFLRRSWA